MRIIWINSVTTKTLSNTRLYCLPPIFNSWGDRSWVQIGGPRTNSLPDFFLTRPVPFGRLGLYQWLVTFWLPYICFRCKPDILLTDWMSAPITRVVVFLRKLGIIRCKLVHDVRTVPVKEDGGKGRRVYKQALNYAKKHFDGITTITDPLRAELCDEFGFSPEQVGVWTSGVDENQFQPQDATELRQQLKLEDKFIIFYHGAVNEKRGVIELALAMAELQDLPELRLLIVGGGNQWEPLKKIVAKKNLNQVILKPSVPYIEIPKWIALADLCAVPLPDHPWWRVSSPLKLMEYMAMAKPILLSDMMAHRAVLPNDADAFYVPNIEPHTLAVGIRKAYSQRQRFDELGARGRQLVLTSFTWQRIAAALKSYLQSVIDGTVVMRRSS